MARFFTSRVKSLQIHIISQQKVTKHNLPVKLVNCLGKVNLLTHILCKFIGLEANSPRNVVKNKRQLFCQLVALTLLFCCLCERLTIILVEMFSNMCYIEDNASRNCQTNTVARSVSSRLALWSLVARRRHAKKVGNFHFIYLVQVTRFYIAVEETLSVYRGARKKQFCKMYGIFLCFKLYNLTVRSVSTCPHTSL